jgi:hypothetical protein
MAKSRTSSGKKKARRSPPTPRSPIVSVRNRDIPERTRILLAVRSGGRCEFAGCSKYTFEHPLTLREGNFSERAHIVAFSEDGPRGRDGKRPADIHAIENLMHLCFDCHELIDRHPTEYTRAILESYKAEHEDRIRHVTGLGKDMRTTIVQLKALIGGQAVDIPPPQVYEAVAPRYPSDRRGHLIDLTTIPVDNDQFMELAALTIDREVEKLYAPGMDVEKTRHISLFALAPMPLLVHLGRRLSNKITVDLFQRHRDAGVPWTWRTSGDPAEYAVNLVQRGSDPCRVALVLSLSGAIVRGNLPGEIDDSFSIYEITLRTATPNVGCLRQRGDLERFRETYRRDFLAVLRRDHSGAKELHVFPAVPAPVAVAVGHDFLPKVDPTLLVYDADKARGGFTLRLRTNDHD